MSWDVMFFSADVKSVEQSNSQTLPILGSKASVIRQVKEVFPDIDCTDPTWCRVDRWPKYSIEFNFMGVDDPIDHLMLHIRGTRAVIDALHELCKVTTWRAFDTTTGDFIDFDNDPARGLEIWQDFFMRVVNEGKAKAEAHGSPVKPMRKWWQFWK